MYNMYIQREAYILLRRLWFIVRDTEREKERERERERKRERERERESL